jgi:ATP-dependent RNA helicase DeaD
MSLATLAERGRVHQLSRVIEKTLGNGIQWLKVPSVKSVMKSLRRRISSSVIAVLPEQEFIPDTAEGENSASLYLDKVCSNLIERLGAEKAVEALVKLSYGEFLDPDRYGPITEFSEDDFKDTGKAFGRAGAKGMIRGREGKFGRHGQSGRRGRATFGGGGAYEGGFSGGQGTAVDVIRVYVGQGRQHGLGAREIAALLMRAGGVPGRMVDEIEMKDYCSFATLPADAAQRACTFSHKDPQGPVIRVAKPPGHGK